MCPPAMSDPISAVMSWVGVALQGAFREKTLKQHDRMSLLGGHSSTQGIELQYCSTPVSIICLDLQVL